VRILVIISGVSEFIRSRKVVIYLFQAHYAHRRTARDRPMTTLTNKNKHDDITINIVTFTCFPQSLFLKMTTKPV